MARASAMRLSCVSAANWDCGAPNPRNAPLGGVFVIAARARIRTLGQAYGPPAWMAPRDRTTGDSVVYAPASRMSSMSWATSRPSRVTPVRWRTTDGCRLVVAAMSSCRSYTIRTGRPALRANRAAWMEIIDGYSSLPPKPPPVSSWMTTTRSPSRSIARLSASWT
jgi:hypothetical protein